MDDGKNIHFDRPDVDTWALARIDHCLLKKIEHSEAWQKEIIPDFPLDEQQMMAMVKGYTPSWECRFAPYLLGGWLYLTRSGHWLKKIRYKKGDDGYYHVVDSYTTQHTKGRNLLVQVISEGYFSPSIIDDRVARLLQEQYETSFKLEGDSTELG